MACLLMFLPGQASANPKYASIVMDADTGMILHQRYADKKLHPASLTKVMTLLMVFEALEQGRAHLNDRIYISRHAASMVPSKLDLPAGSSIRLEDAIFSLVTKSANDIAVAVAEHFGKTESNFARMMTLKARQIGMSRTQFRNASGLHNPGQISTARDMAKMARYVIQNYPARYKYFSTKNFSYRGKNYHNHNRLMSSYKGMDGMKTGYVNASGFNLVASAVRNNRRLIGVVFGGRTSKTRNNHMAMLLDRGFAKMNDIRIASARVPLPPHKPGILVALQALNKVSPSSGQAKAGNAQKWAALNPALENGKFSEIIGEGDFDPALSKRIETGLIAIAAHKQDRRSARTAAPARIQNAAAIRSPYMNDVWGIQVGAFTSRAATDKVLHQTLRKLPVRYAKASPVIAPLKTRDGWLFRARLNGYSKQEAFEACRHLPSCLPVAPKNN